MNIIAFTWLVFITIIFAYSFLFIFCYLPAWKKSQIANSLAILARCLKILDQNYLQHQKIKKGDYLHDRFYKTLFLVLKYQIKLYPDMLNRLKYNDEIAVENSRFNQELSRLDNDTKDSVQRAMLHLGLILFLRNPLITIRLCLRLNEVRQGHESAGNINILKRKVTETARFITLRPKELFSC